LHPLNATSIAAVKKTNISRKFFISISLLKI
jgi:hypothetical protein